MLLPEKLIQLLQQNQIDCTSFNHFDYVEVFEKLSDLDLQGHPKKRKLVEEFAQKCINKISEDCQEDRKAKADSFLKRMEMHELLRKQKIEALRFIQEKYDSRSQQLYFYPKTNARKATQHNRYWKDVDGFEGNIESEGNILCPNGSVVQYDKDRSIWE